jgi:D-alanyl-D-alanine carboxypeptidase (penicillin-binding protein 5/6)
MKMKILAAAAVLTLFSAPLCSPLAAQNPEDAATSNVKTGPKGYTAAYVIEPVSGRVLFADNENTPVPTASMVKMMTCLIVMEEIDAGRLTLDTPVTISARASLMGGSQIYAKQGQTFPVKTLLAATMIQSANDAAMALAEKVGGSAESFATLMNQRGKKMGLKNSTFYDPHGLPSKVKGQDDVMSARDLAVLGMELMKHPLMREYAAMPTMAFSNGTFTSGMTNPNHLLKDYDGAYGIKTGYTVGAGFSVTAAAKRGGMDVIAVVTGAKTSRGPNSSFDIAARLMNDAFVRFSTVTPIKKGAVAGKAPVGRGKVATVDAVAVRDASAVVARGEEASVTSSFEPDRIQAPVKKGQPVGTIVLKANGKEVARVPAVAAADVAVRPWWQFWSLEGG